MSTYERMLEIATEAHSGQKRWNGDAYITHPQRIANTFKDFDLKIIALAHDLYEDTNITPQYLLSEGFSPLIVETIQILTRIKPSSYLEYIIRIKKCPYATAIKIADLKDNMQDLRPGNMKDKYELALHILTS